MVSLETVLIRTDRCLCSEIDRDLIMLDIESGCYFALDPIGRDIWARLEQPVRVSDLCTALEQTYDAPAEVIRADVLRLLTDMAGEGLVSVAG